ncbi:uncharacterized protein A1O5_11255 [Cladophialophora psammophila CBS 110553]|uniref:Cupin type-1 domain-containing protein n=1 Tax=Cladophialophora psammophila CBS 110553 TaxID=1182543 RepID=W9WC97_9EURO|nr:uncharacterized protein A1O5_11255 [Cladophialophora psammophila CBS 110553]EXJ65727.1 hypothetical protein A1O5_11255 [Cladophialophora psammophila CBS 110553]
MALIPNSPRPLLHYPGIPLPSDCMATAAYDAFSDNGWRVQWIFRYHSSLASHYHSATPECMAALSGSATIRFGVADTVPDPDESTFGSGKEDGGIELQARAGDVFVIPACVAHKTFNIEPRAEFKLLTPGDGHHIAADHTRSTLESLQLSGFTMIGAYPEGGSWDFANGGENVGNYEVVWAVPTLEKDPVLAKAEEGLCGHWK